MGFRADGSVRDYAADVKATENETESVVASDTVGSRCSQLTTRAVTRTVALGSSSTRGQVLPTEALATTWMSPPFTLRLSR